MDPKKPVGTDSMFKYNLLLCPKIPQKKTEVRKKIKKDLDLTTN